MVRNNAFPVWEELVEIVVRAPEDQVVAGERKRFQLGAGDFLRVNLQEERAADAERRLDGLTDPMQRLRLARSTAESLGATGSPSDSGMELPGRLVRLQEHWRTVAAQCQRTVDLLQQQEQHKRRQRRRMLAIAIVAFVATSTAIGFAIKPWFAGEPAHAGERSAPQNSPNNK